MKKIITIAFGLCGLINAMQGPVQLPTAGVLKSRLQNQGFEDFVKISQIDQDLGDKEILPINIVWKVNSALNRYEKDPLCKNADMRAHKKVIVAVLLQDHLPVVQDLEQQGFLK